jgi:hypothetical protein
MSPELLKGRLLAESSSKSLHRCDQLKLGRQR